MAHIRPFQGIRYAKRADLDLSALIAPPYDVLDEKGKAALQARHPNNIVTVDLPHLPPKTAGPDEAYEKANITLQAWLSAGILKRDAAAGHLSVHAELRTPRPDAPPPGVHRPGPALSPSAQGQVVPHEKTYAGPIEDRLKLMRATRTQLSPIFGLFSDARNEVTNLLYHNLGRPDQSGTLGRRAATTCGA